MSKSIRIFSRPMPIRDPDESHRAATPLELFFDLVTVVAIASLTTAFHHSLSHGDGLSTLPQFIFCFLAIYWPWINYTWFASTFDNGDPLYRILTFVIMTGYLIFAAGVPFVFEDMNQAWGVVGWTIMRIGMIILWLRAAQNTSGAARKACLRYAGGLFFAQTMWILFLLVLPRLGATDYSIHNPEILTIGIFMWLFEFSIPFLAGQAFRLPFHRHHIIERFGLFNIVVLGEIILSISFAFAALYEGEGNYALIVYALNAVIMLYLIWWIYFADPEHLKSMRIGVVIAWSMGHIIILMGETALGAALAANVDILLHDSHASSEEIRRYIAYALATVLFGIWFVRERFSFTGTHSIILLLVIALVLLAARLEAPFWVYTLLLLGFLVFHYKFAYLETDGARVEKQDKSVG